MYVIGRSFGCQMYIHHVRVVVNIQKSPQTPTYRFMKGMRRSQTGFFFDNLSELPTRLTEGITLLCLIFGT